MIKFINKSIRNKIVFWMLLSLIISSFTILTSTSQKIKEDHLSLAKQQLQLFSNTIFNQLRIKMAEGNTEEMNLILERAKGFENVYDVKIHKSEKLHFFTNSKEKLTTDKEISAVFSLRSSLVEEKMIDGKEYVKLATPIIASNECLKCHTNQKDGDVVAVMEIVFSLESFDKHSQDIVWNIVYSSFFFGFITIIVLLYIINRATEPIEGLKYGFERLLNSDDGRNNVKLRIRTNDEIGDVALLFNQYIDKLTLEFKKSTEKFAQNIIDAQSDLIITYDENKKIANVNRAFLDFFDVHSLDQFIKRYGDNIGSRFVENSLDHFIKEDMNGIRWEHYIQENKHTIHKVILKNNKTSEVFTVSTNSISFDNALYTTSVFTNINEIEKIRKEAQESHAQLKTLFDNANEGFLYFDRSMKIGNEYSLQAQEIFGCELQNRKITDLLFDDLEERNFIEDTLVSILSETPMRQEVLISLLKNQFVINHKFIEVQYKVINNSGFMLILEDVTENKILNDKIADEQQMYKMVIAVIAFFDQFLEIKEEYQKFIQTFEQFKKLEKLPDLRREIHTFKGLFAQLEMLHIVKRLHELETQIDNSIKFREINDDVYFLSGKILFSWLEHDVQIINGILNQDILTKSHVYKIEKERIDTIYENIDNCNDIELLKKQVMQLTYRNIKDTFYGYGQLVRTLASRFDKPMNELVIEGEDIYLSKRYQPFLNTLVHLFRNSLDHGIESLEEREIFQKDPKGTISCSVAVENDKLIIIYKDDGKGIDIERLQEKLVSKKLLDEDEVEQLSQDQLLQYIFSDGFSTADLVTEISGRGVGLYSLKNEVDQLGGTIKIINYPHEGIVFIFKLTLFDL